MDMAANKALFNQVRIAHRLLASYYQRTYQLISDVSSDDRLELEFLSWDPTEFCRPIRRTSNVLGRWAVDLLPGVATEYLFLHSSKGKSQRPGDWLLVMTVISDTAVTYKNGKDTLKLPVSPEDACSVLRCYLIAPHKALNVDWYNGVWDPIEYPECTETQELQCMDDEQQIYATAFEVPLEELTEKDSAEKLVQKIIAYREAVLPKTVVT